MLCCHAFMLDIADRITERCQLATDGHHNDLSAVENAFGLDVDCAQLVKMFGPDGGSHSPERKYSPGKCNGAKKVRQFGMPHSEHISTSYVERQNLTPRMSSRRFTRLTNAFSKKLENHAHAIALHYWVYNFTRKQKTLGTTSAVAAGIADRAYTIDDLVNMLEGEERIVANGGRINRVDRT